MKKGSFKVSSEMFVTMIPVVIALSIIIAVVVTVLVFRINRDTEMEELEAYTLAKRIYFSENCLSFNGIRNYPGEIDFNKLSLPNFENCVKIDNSRKGVIISLKDINGVVVKEVELNDKISRLLDLCDVEKKNFHCYYDRYFISNIKNGPINNGFLDLNVVIMNE